MLPEFNIFMQCIFSFFKIAQTQKIMCYDSTNDIRKFHQVHFISPGNNGFPLCNHTLVFISKNTLMFVLDSNILV